jgi:inhibitor of cysteine peptidase
MFSKRAVHWLATGCLCFSAVVFAAPKNPPAPTAAHLQDKPAFVVMSDQPVFQIKLKSNPTTGYSWYLREWNSEVVEPLKHQFEAPTTKKLMGAPGYEIWTFRAKPGAFVVPLQTILRFVYARSWEVGENPSQAVFRVTTVRSSAAAE